MPCGVTVSERKKKPLSSHPGVVGLYCRLGDFEAALGLLEQLLPHANEEIKAWIKVDADFDALRSHPRYQKALQSVQ